MPFMSSVLAFLQELHGRLDAPQAEPTSESTGKLLAMYVNRGNASYATSATWGPPTLWDR